MSEISIRAKASLSRREFVRVVCDGVVILMLPPPVGRPHPPSAVKAEPLSPSDQDQPGYRLRFFTKEEAAAVEAINARIIPSDETPGAREARVVYFIDYLLATEYKAQQSVYRAGLRRLEKVAHSRFKRPFAALTAAEQDSLLVQMERQEIAGWTDAGDFFSLVCAHTIEGMFSDPKYHGNAGGIGWKLIGADTHPRV